MKFKNFKKTISLILTLTTVLSASFAIADFSASADIDVYDYGFENENVDNLVKGANVLFVDEAREGDTGTTFTKKAAYLPPRQNASASNITYQMKITSAGKYRLSFDLDVFGGNSPCSTGNILVGLYDGTPNKTYNRGYSSNENTARLVAYDKNTNSEATKVVYDDETGRKRGTTVKLKANDVYNYKFISEFEIAEAKDIFIGICFYFNSKDGSNTDHAYMDNIKLSIKTNEDPTPQTYDDPKTVYYIDFDGDKSRLLDHNYRPSLCFVRSTDTAHSGKYSARFNPKSADGYKYLCYTDNNGYNVMEPTLKPNTAYRFSFWYNQPAGDQNTKYGYQPLNESLRSARVRSAGWQQFTYDFITDDNPDDDPRKTIWICAAYYGGSSYLYFDDIKLEELSPSVLSVDEEETYCEEYQNRIENGRFEKELNGTIWDSDSISVKRIKAAENDKADSGDYYAHLSGNALLKVRIKVRSNYVNKYAFSYRMSKKNNLKIGILDNNGNVMNPISGAGFTETSLITPTNTDGEWHRFCYSFLSPIDGYVYFYIEGSALDIELDEISLFRNTQGYDEDPNVVGKIPNIPISEGSITNQVFTFGKTPVKSNIKGTGGVLPCWWYFPDSTIDGGYSESDIQIAVEQLKNMEVSIVRCLSFQPGYAWDEANGNYNWDSVYMQAFYRYATVLKDNGMEIVINPNRNLAGSEAGEPICTPFKKASDAKNEDEYNRLYGEWVVELINEVIIKRGFTNIKYLMYNTESNNISGITTESEEAYYAEHKKYFDTYLGRVKASDKAMREAGVRDYLKIVGPNSVNGPTATGFEKYCGTRWLEWAVQYGNDCIDIYSAHFYAYVSDFTQDVYADIVNQEKEFVEIVKPTGKEFWHDEFNTIKKGSSSALTREDDPLDATTIASMVLGMYEGGAQSSMLWYLFDVKWPESDLTAPPERFEGIHYGGVCPVSYESTIPYTAYYMWCALGSAIRSGDTVYVGTTDGENFHSMLLKHVDGTYSIVAVNITWDKTDVTFKLPVSLNGKEFTKTVYDPTTVTPTTEYKPLEPTGTVKITNSFKDTIGSYQVVVYNQK